MDQIMVGVGIGLAGGPVYTFQDPPAPIAVDRGKEYVSGAPRPTFAGFSPSAVPQFDEVYSQYGDLLIDWMMLDEMISSSFHMIWQSVLADGIRFESIIPPAEAEEADQDAAGAAEADLAGEIADWAARSTKRLKRPLEAVVYEMESAMAYRAQLGELVWAVAADGPDKDRWVHDRINTKPRWSWALVTDPYGNVVSVACSVPEVGLKYLPRDHFAIFTWMPRAGNPAGSTLCRPAFNGYNVKLKAWPDYDLFLSKMAAASIIATTPQGALPRREKDANGNEVGPPISPQQDLSNQITTLFVNASVVAVPFGTEIEKLEVDGDGTAFTKALDEANNAIATAIIQAPRALREAQHGSKADAQVAQDVTGIVVRMVKSFVAQMVREDILRPGVEANWGPQAARLTPCVVLGDTDHQDLPNNVNALANAARSMLVNVNDKAHVRALFRWLGLPVPESRGDIPLPAQSQQVQQAPNSQPATPAPAR
jgi:hypothetical protein